MCIRDSNQSPPERAAVLVTDELAYLEEQVLRPARQAAEAVRVRDENQRPDPIQRLDSAGEQIREAAVLSQVAVVPYVRIKGLVDALSGVKTFGSISAACH